MAGQSGKNRKYGRGKKRPSNVAYTGARRWVSNKAKAVARDAKRKQDKVDHPAKVERGTARSRKRVSVTRKTSS